VLAHVERDDPKPTQKMVARARIRSGRPQPLPGPGVLASGNAIGTPALLPDGSISTESVMVSTPGGTDISLDSPQQYYPHPTQLPPGGSK
jgi:NADH-quinone oxidoreductase subunit J